MAADERIAAVDVLRGFALLGILVVNMELFSIPLSAWWLSTPWWPSTLDRTVTWGISTFAEGKFYALFSFLFGLGMYLQMDRIERRGGRFVSIYARRLLVLLGIGLAHALLLWFGDILVLYALMGWWLLVLRRRRNVALLVTAILVFCVPIVLQTAQVYEPGVPPPASSPAEQVAQDEEAQADYRQLAKQTTATYSSGTWVEIFRQRLADNETVLWGTAFMAPVVFAMFMLGLMAGRARLLHDPAAHRTLLRRLVCWGLPLGILLNAAFATIDQFGPRGRTTWWLIPRQVFVQAGTPLLTFGYAAVIVLLVQRESWRPRLAPLAAVGRMALTNYLLQTLICTTLCYSYGLGWFGRIRPAWGLVLSVAIYAMQIPLSVWWLQHFQFGPMEWLWRSLTYLKWQPLRSRYARLPPPTHGFIDT